MSRDRVIHSDDLPWTSEERGELFARRRRRLADSTEAQNLGCSMIELDPGKTAFPFHYHLANEEALYVLAGEGTLRLGAERVRVRTGDYIAFPPGPEHAHQLTNTGSEVLRYLVVSTMARPEIAVYPDSGKVGVYGTLPPDKNGEPRGGAMFPMDARVGYWDGEVEPSGDAERAESSEAPEDPVEAQRQREAALDERVESDLEALKRKLEAEGHTQPSAPEPQPEPEPAPSSDTAGDSDIEDDLEALKRKIAAERAGGQSKADAEPAASSSSSASPRPSDDLDELKRQLDSDS
ncbi:MAG: cupin domain-containing protein [Myxococcota bacterium]